MNDRKIKHIHQAEYRPIADLITYSPMPTHRLQHLDPFLFLNHHGYQEYPSNNNGLPFGPHPHRGMETVTFILEGDIMHEDSGGHKEIIGPKGVQYMTAGSGLIHAEVSSPDFKKNGGPLEILQLWLNLPANQKMKQPAYIGKQADEMQEIELGNGASLQLIFGTYDGVKGSFEPSYPIWMGTLFMKSNTTFDREIPASQAIFLYVVRGSIKVGDTEVKARHLVEFEHRGELVSINANEDAIVILGHAEPFHEPIVAQGPFVMNSQAQIQEAYRDYQMGRFS